MPVETLTSPPSATSDRPAAAPSLAPRASIAFGLGWHVAELFHFEFISDDGKPADGDGLLDINQLPSRARADLLRMQIGVALERLGRSEMARGVAALEVREDEETAISREELRRLHERLLERLTAEDPGLGRAYDVGRALAETAVVPTTDDPPTFAKRFSPNRVQTLKSELSDLRGRFPGHASEAVEETLDAWRSWVTERKLDGAGAKWTLEQERGVAKALQRQGGVWYALLSGDMDPSRLLTVDDYLSATKALLSALSELVWSSIRRMAAKIGLPRMLLVALAALIVAFVLYKVTNSVFGAILSFLVLIFAVLGVTLGGLRALLRQALQQAGDRLWEAELLNSIGHSVIHLPELPAS
jgi:hypothetical protein